MNKGILLGAGLGVATAVAVISGKVLFSEAGETQLVEAGKTSTAEAGYPPTPPQDLAERLVTLEAQMARVLAQVEKTAEQIDALEKNASRLRQENSSAKAPSEPHKKGAPPSATQIRVALEEMAQSGELEKIKAKWEESIRTYWKQQTPQIDPEQALEMEKKLDEAVALVEQAYSEAGGNVDDLPWRVREKLRTIKFDKSGVQVSVFAPDGKFVYHVEGMIGYQAMNHADINGERIYQKIIESSSDGGSTNVFDWIEDNKGRQLRILYRKIAHLKWTVTAEGHEWKEMK